MNVHAHDSRLGWIIRNAAARSLRRHRIQGPAARRRNQKLQASQRPAMQQVWDINGCESHKKDRLIRRFRRHTCIHAPEWGIHSHVRSHPPFLKNITQPCKVSDAQCVWKLRLVLAMLGRSPLTTLLPAACPLFGAILFVVAKHLVDTQQQLARVPHRQKGQPPCTQST